MAQTTNIKNDPVVFELLNKDHNIGSLEGFYNSYQKEMSLLQHSFLLYRVNKVYREIKKRNLQAGKSTMEDRMAGTV